MHQSCTRQETEIDTSLRAADIHILNLRALAEMLHDCGAVENRIDFPFDNGGQIIGDIAQDDANAVAKQFIECGFEIIEQKGFQSVLGGIVVLSAH